MALPEIIKPGNISKHFFPLAPLAVGFMIESVPEFIFSLVKRNEQDLLVPFLKHLNLPMAALRDESGNTLLYQAIHPRGVAQKHHSATMQSQSFSLGSCKSRTFNKGYECMLSTSPIIALPATINFKAAFAITVEKSQWTSMNTLSKSI